MHQHPARHVRDEEIIAVAVAKPRGPRECPLLRFGIGDVAFLRRRIFLFGDAKREFGKVLQLELFLLPEA